ncbi:MAG: site-specific integrase [Verrucomicrobiota bacterium]
MKQPTFPLKVTVRGITGISATVYKQDRSEAGKGVAYLLSYSEKGKRKMKSFAELDRAIAAGELAINDLAGGVQTGTLLTHLDKLVYARAVEALAGLGVPLDTACQEYAAARALLGGKATILEACQEWMRRNATPLPQIMVADAVEELKKQAKSDGKSQRRRQQLAAVLDAFAKDFNKHVHVLTPAMIADYLSGLQAKERTKRNHRDVLGYFNRWLIMRGYLAKGTDLLDGVQNYTARKLGDISIYTPDELAKLISAADDRILPFILIGAFAGLRHAEIARLDWQDIDLAEGHIEIRAENAKTKTRRVVPINATLKAWLQDLAKKQGKVVPVANTTKQLLKLARGAGVTWKHNAMRHTWISARLAQCKNVAQVAYEAGNSPQVIKTNYDAVLTEKKAAAWFAVMPSGGAENVAPLESARV